MVSASHAVVETKLMKRLGSNQGRACAADFPLPKVDDDVNNVLYI